MLLSEIEGPLEAQLCNHWKHSFARVLAHGGEACYNKAKPYHARDGEEEA